MLIIDGRVRSSQTRPVEYVSEEIISSVANTASNGPATLSLVENYIYLYHLGIFVILPSWPDNIQDSMNVNFASNTPMLRTAPIYSYSYSGPRTVSFQLLLHRDLMTQINLDNTSVQLNLGEDYVDLLVNQIQAVALPQYDSSTKLVNPPIVALRFGDDIYIKGVVTGAVSVGRMLPIIQDKQGKSKYAQIQLSFTVNEIEPFDAESVMQAGSFRGMDTSLERNFWQYKEISSGRYSVTRNFV